jgi:hypothetical protein
MRKIVLVLTIALLGLATAVPAANATRNLVEDNITLTGNESVNAKVSIDVAGLWPYLDIHIIICSRDALDDCNYEKRAQTLRKICFSTDQTNSDNCLAYPTSPIEIELFRSTQWIGSSAVLPTGMYEIKVIEYNSESTATRYLAVETISDSSFVLKYDKEPTLTGPYDVGSTLQLQSPIWSPTPFDVEIEWFRCNKTTTSFFIRGNEEVPYQNLGIDCYRINQDGTRYEAPVELVGVMREPESAISSHTLVASTRGFKTYEIRPVDIGSSITAIISAYGDFDSRKFGVESTPIITAPVVEQRTKPINQAVPTVALKKTKKNKKLQVGATITTTTGTWKWSNSSKYQWFACTKRQRSSASVNTKLCTPIKRATKATYKVKKQDKGRFLLVNVTATNELGTTSLTSASTGKIK